MNPSKVRHDKLEKLTDLPNIGPAIEKKLNRIGITRAEQLKNRDAMDLYDELCEISGCQYDPCVIDVFMSIISFMNGQEAKPWWAFTEHRKQRLAHIKTHQGR